MTFTADHEAGHAVVAEKLGIAVVRVVTGGIAGAEDGRTGEIEPGHMRPGHDPDAYGVMWCAGYPAAVLAGQADHDALAHAWGDHAHLRKLGHSEDELAAWTARAKSLLIKHMDAWRSLADAVRPPDSYDGEFVRRVLGAAELRRQLAALESRAASWAEYETRVSAWL